MHHNLTTLRRLARPRGGFIAILLFVTSILSATTAPTVTVVSRDISARAGEEVRFAATISGPGTLSIQWFRQGQPVEGGNAAELIIAHVAESDVGTYQVVAENEFGSTLGAGRVELRVISAIEFTRHPESVAVRLGEPIRLEAEANGEGVALHWLRGDLMIPAESDGSLVIESATFADGGVYSAVGVGTYGEGQSRLARVDVFPSEDPGVLQLDPDWKIDLEIDQGRFHAVGALANGGFVVVGDFDRINGHETRSLAKFDASGQVDTTFVSTTDPGDQARSILELPDGKILVGGDFSTFGEERRWGGVLRFEADGSFDEDFHPASMMGGDVTNMGLSPDGVVYLTSRDFSQSLYYTIKRLMADGEIDPSFSQSSSIPVSVGRFAVSENGQVHVASFSGQQSNLYTLDDRGTLVWSFEEEFFEEIYGVGVDASDRIYAVGKKRNVSSTTAWLRFDSGGQVDEAYAGERLSLPPRQAVVQPDGGLLLAAAFSILAVNSEGEWLGDIHSASSLTQQIILDSSSRLVFVANEFPGFNGGPSIRRFSSDAATSAELVSALTQNGVATGILPYADGKYLIVGHFDRANGQLRSNAVLVSALGQIESDLLSGGFNGSVVHARQASSGDLYFAGGFNLAFGIPSSGMFRLKPDGSPDLGFSTNLHVDGLNSVRRRDAFEVLADGSVVLVGFVVPTGTASKQIGMIRVSPTGILDSSFNAAVQQWESALSSRDLIEQLDGRLMISGFFAHNPPVLDFRWANPDGTLSADEPAIRSFNRFILAVEEDTEGNVWSFGVDAINRYPIGSAEPNLTNPPLPLPNNEHATDEFVRLLRQPDGKMIAFGNMKFRNPGIGIPPSRDYLARFNSDGSVDLDFEVKGLPSMVDSLLQLEDGNLLIGSGGSVQRTAPLQAPELMVRATDDVVEAGESVRFIAEVSGFAESHQWYHNGQQIAGATSAVLRIPAAQVQDTGFYRVVAKNETGASASRRLELSVLDERSRAAATHQAAFPLIHIVEPKLLQMLGRIDFSGTPTGVTWSVLIPEGWSLRSFYSDGATTSPTGIVTGLAEWTWENPDPGRLQIYYDVIPPTASVGRWEFPAMLTMTTNDEVIESMASPDPLVLRMLGPSLHAADVDQDRSINLAELLRVIEIYNTRSGTSRTGRYRLNEYSVDGFGVDPEDGAFGEMSVFHSADTDRDATLSLGELLRVIELYNTRAGTQRTGGYVVSEDSVDGFAPDVGAN